MHPRHRKYVGGFWGPALAGIAASVAPNIFEKIFGGKRKRIGKKAGRRRSRVSRRGRGELVNSGPLP